MARDLRIFLTCAFAAVGFHVSAIAEPVKGSGSKGTIHVKRGNGKCVSVDQKPR